VEVVQRRDTDLPDIDAAIFIVLEFHRLKRRA
jgi:hypothetical protein